MLASFGADTIGDTRRELLREISSRLLDLGLLFRQESREGDDVGVHAGALCRRHLAVSVGRHIEMMVELIAREQSRRVKWQSIGRIPCLLSSSRF